jgi:3',5'-cyclic AMP phosphodiesterase CpdA
VISSQLRTTALATAMTLAACGEPTVTTPTPPGAQRVASSANAATDLAWLRSYLSSPHAPAAGEPAVLAGAGDIARCYPGSDATRFQPPGPGNPAERTAQLLDDMPGATVMAVGDNAYEFGSPFDYSGCYQPTWGRHLQRTRPAAGNHEYLTPGAAGYFTYFGARSAPPLGYYSYSLGSWHVVVLNSTPQVYACWPPELNENLPDFPLLPVPPHPGPAAGRVCAGDLAQQAWLIRDLAAHRADRCTVVYFHHPRFSSGLHGNHYQMQRIWDIMYVFGVDLVIDGHDHLYERFAPQNPNGRLDTRWGIRQITVGTGGADFYSLRERQPNSEVLITDVWGVIALALGDGQYSWEFESIDHTIRDSGSEGCHDRPGRA